MVRVVRAYFDIMIANANLTYTRVHKKAVAEQLRQNEEQFKVGVVPITNVYEAQANYDQVSAQEISDRYTLARRIESLRQITNQLYCHLKGLNAYLPLVAPEPANINAWVCAVEKQNYQLQAARLNAIAYRQNIKVQSADTLPVVNSFGEFNYTYDSNFDGSTIFNRQKILEAGVSVDWSPIQGGGITARTRQAAFYYQQACQQQEQVHRQVVANARNAYLGVYSGIAQVCANQSSVRSGIQSLKATTESFKVGTRTILDVLNQQSTLINSLKAYTTSRYEYIYQTVLLKQAAGTLCVEDLQHINCWLYESIDISMYDALLSGCIMPSTH
jgi:outer membrane protein